MKTPRIDVARIRREQIVDAASAIIDAKGLQKLSLSEIEKKAGMSRGQLTYYFPAKEDILLAVFDRMLQQMKARADKGHKEFPCTMNGHRGWERARSFLTWFVLNPPDEPEFHSLQYTFLSQIPHRDDFRQRLASLYEEWRQMMMADVAEDLGRRSEPPHVSPRTLATLVQAILHGLAIQRMADPSAYDRQEMLELCMTLFDTFFRRPASPRPKKSRTAASPALHRKSSPRNGTPRRASRSRSSDHE